MKPSWLRHLLAAVIAPAVLLAAPASPAYASPGAAEGVITGSGSISPGLTAVPAPQNFSFSGTALLTGVVNGSPEVDVPHGITASGTDLAGSYAEGAGTINITIAGYATMSGVFVRVGAVVFVTVTGGPPTVVGVGICGFVAAQIPPAGVTSYTVVCTSHSLTVT